MNGNKIEKKQTGRWSKEEHQRFMLGLMQYGKNWKKVEQIVATRSGSQVRSHAQKFFNKLQKSSSDNKLFNDSHSNNQSKDEPAEDFHNEQISLNDNTDFMRSHDDDNQLQTPLEIIQLIKKQSLDNRKINLSSFKKSLQENQQKHHKKTQDKFQHTENSAFHSLTDTKDRSSNLPVIKEEVSGGLPFLNSFKSMNNILSAYEALNENDPENHLQDESFLIGLTKKYKKYFSKGGQFQGLIDFGNPHEVAKAAELQKSIRKKSWTLAEGIQGNQNDLQDIKNQLKENKHSVSQAQILEIEQKNYSLTKQNQQNQKKQQFNEKEQPSNHPQKQRI